MELEKKESLIQSSALTWSRFDFTALELDLLVVIIQKLSYDKTKKADFVELNISEVDRICGSSNQNSKRIREALQSLQVKLISWNQGGTWISTQLIGSTEYTAGTGRVKVYFTPVMLNMLRDYSRYTVFFLQSIFKLSSVYEKRIYQMARNYTRSRAWIVSIDGLRQMLNVPPSYNFTTFYERVIVGSCKAITEKTEITIVPMAKKEGRKFIDLVFTVELKDIDRPLSMIENKQIQTLKAWGFSDYQIIQIRKQLHSEDLRKLIFAAKQNANNPGAYLQGMLTKTGFTYVSSDAVPLFNEI